MSYTNKTRDQESGLIKITQKLMVHGFVCPESSCALSIEIRRGMPILSEEGLEMGKVAAVILDGGTEKATHVLLGRLPEIRGYWMVPVDLISEVRGEAVLLRIPGNMIERLPLWQSGD